MKKCISVILTIFMVFSLIMIPINIVYGQADVRAPELKSIRIDKKEVIAGDKVTFTAEITDDISGVDSVCVYLEVPGHGTKNIWLKEKEKDIYEGSYEVGENDANGIWKIERIVLSDKQGNWDHINSTEYGGSTDFTSCNFEVSGNDKADVRAPELKSIRIDKKEVIAGDKVTFTAEITDDISGVDSVCVYLEVPGHGTKNIWLKEKEKDIYEGSYEVGENDANGIWKIERIVLSDKQGNWDHINSTEYGGSTDFTSCNFEVKEDNNPIKQISGTTVISSNKTLSNKIINGDLYIAPNIALSANNLTVNGNIYVLGGLLAGNISVSGTVYCNSSTTGYTTTLSPGMFAWYGSCSMSGLTCSNRIVNMIPLRFDEDLIVDANGNLNLKGATLNIADMSINGDDIKLDSKGRFDQIVNVGEADQITITRHIEGWYDLKQTIDVQHEKPESLKIESLPDKTVYQDGDKLVSKGLKVKAVYKNGTEKDVTDYVKLSDINGLGTNKIKVIYRGCETTFDVEVNEVKAESITLDKTNIILEIGKTEQLNPVIKPDNVSNKKVSYESSDNSIASVDSEGKITALKEGNVIIMATTSNNLKVECEVQVIKHTHQWNEGQVSREPSCTEVGEKEYICKTCGEKKTEEIVAKGHEWSSEYTVDKKATCTEKGKESIHCKVCGAIKEGSEKEISATGHQWDKGKVTKEAECTRAGEKEYTCETCGAKKTEEIAAKGHEWSSEYTVDKKATCTEKGKESIHCKVCGAIKEGSEKEISATGHQWDKGKVTKEAECTRAGEKEYTCEICGVKKTEEIAVKGHEWSNEYTVDKKATCTEKGEESIHCKVCGEIKEGSQKEISAYNHSETEIKNAKKETYTSEGYTGDIYCKICNKKISTGKKIKKLVAKIPQKVTGCKLVAKKKKIKVSYKKVKEGVKYQIQYSVKKNMKSSKIRTTKNTQYLITKLKSKKKYYVRIRAINNQGRFGAWSQIKHVKTK